MRLIGYALCLHLTVAALHHPMDVRAFRVCVYCVFLWTDVCFCLFDAVIPCGNIPTVYQKDRMWYVFAACYLLAVFSSSCTPILYMHRGMCDICRWMVRHYSAFIRRWWKLTNFANYFVFWWSKCNHNWHLLRLYFTAWTGENRSRSAGRFFYDLINCQRSTLTNR